MNNGNYYGDANALTGPGYSTQQVRYRFIAMLPTLIIFYIRVFNNMFGVILSSTLAGATSRPSSSIHSLIYKTARFPFPA